MRSIVPTGTLGRNGRIQAGDYLVSVNGENMRNISLNQALDILRRTQKVPLGNKIPITYIPASDALVYKTSVITRIQTSKMSGGSKEEEENGKATMNLDEQRGEEENGIERTTAVSSQQGVPILTKITTTSSTNNVSHLSGGGSSAPTPAARNTLLSSSTTRTEKKANGTTVISIGPGASMGRLLSKGF